MKVKLYKTGQVVKNGKVVSEQYAELESETTKFCWLHPQIMSHLENRKNPTERDKKLLAKITFTSSKSVDKKGNVTFYRSCPKCHQSIKIENKSLVAPTIDTNINEKVIEEISQSNKNSPLL
jgi:hypothetical protein